MPNTQNILCNESTSGLDPITANENNKLILKVQRQFDTTSMIITHFKGVQRIQVGNNDLYQLSV